MIFIFTTQNFFVFCFCFVCVFTDLQPCENTDSNQMMVL